MTDNNPLAKPDTAFGELSELKYKPEMEVADRYQSFITELLRLSLLGIAAFGFLYKEVFHDFDATKHPNIDIQTIKSLAAWGVLMFGVSAFFALVFRYWSAEAFRLYVEGLRFKDVKDPNRSQLKLTRRDYVILVCIVAKAGAALALAAGAMLISFSFYRLLG